MAAVVIMATAYMEQINHLEFFSSFHILNKLRQYVIIMANNSRKKIH